MIFTCADSTINMQILTKNDVWRFLAISALLCALIAKKVNQATFCYFFDWNVFKDLQTSHFYGFLVAAP